MIATPEIQVDRTRAVGVDVVDVAAFASQWDAPGTHFARAFTPAERRSAKGGATPESESLASRWAAKEAVLKAWSGTRYGRPDDVDAARVDLREIEVRSDAWGRPAIRLHGEVARHLAAYDVLVSLSHDGGVATAFVVLLARGTE